MHVPNRERVIFTVASPHHQSSTKPPQSLKHHDQEHDTASRAQTPRSRNPAEGRRGVNDAGLKPA
jgi:hypothetical protein